MEDDPAIAAWFNRRYRTEPPAELLEIVLDCARRNGIRGWDNPDVQHHLPRLMGVVYNYAYGSLFDEEQAIEATAVALACAWAKIAAAIRRGQDPTVPATRVAVTIIDQCRHGTPLHGTPQHHPPTPRTDHPRRSPVALGSPAKAHPHS